METFTQYYFIDWVGMVLSFTALYLLGNKKRMGFLIGIGGNICWMSFAAMVGSVPGVVANAVLICLNIRGYLRWEKKVKVNV